MEEVKIDQKTIQPEPSYGLPEAPKTETQLVDARTFTFLVYALFRCNVISRVGVRDLLDLIKSGKHPEDIVTYLMSEVRKI